MNIFTKITFILLLLLLFSYGFSFVRERAEQDKILREKIGQMLIIGFRGTEITEEDKTIKDINDLNVGGVILFDYDVPSASFPRNIVNPEQTKQLIEDINEYTDGSLFIAVDAEGGYVNRLKDKYGFIKIPSAQELGQKTLSETKNTIKPLAMQLAYLGFNLNFAPDVDVNVNPDNPVIGYLERSFSDDPEIVASQAEQFIEAMHESNIITAIKHFPGHGSSTEDSHLGLVDITDTYNQETELYPFKTLIENNIVDMVMTAHVINQNIDENYPATLSSLFLQDILREDLDYQGIIVSDDMQMGAIADNYGFEEAVIQSINAGCNILIFSNNNQEYDENISQKAVEIIYNAVKDKKIPLEKIEESYDKIIQIKEQYGIIEAS